MDKWTTIPLDRRGARAIGRCPPMPHDVFISQPGSDGGIVPTATAARLGEWLSLTGLSRKI
jgi:hypothetical protein